MCRSIDAQQRLCVILLCTAFLAAACGAEGRDSSAAISPRIRSDVTVQGSSVTSQTSTAPVCNGQDGRGRKVGYGDLGGDVVPFGVAVRLGLQRVAEECNIELIVLNNALDGPTALVNAEEFAAQEVDAVIEFQVDGNIEAELCQALGDRPVIAIDIAHPSCAEFMGADNSAAGELAGEALGIETLRRWNCQLDAVVSVENFAVGQVNVDRTNGALRGLSSVCGFLNLGDFEDWDPNETGSVITRIDTSGAFVDGALEAGRDWLAEHPDAAQVVVHCINDDSCIAFKLAVQEAGRTGQFIYASQGADPSVRDVVRTDRHYVGSTGFLPEKYGERLIPAIIRMMDDPTTTGPFLMDHVFIDARMMDVFYPAE